MAKGFGNGAAIGATLLKSEISDSMSGKLFFNTFGSDPYQTMQAKITMDIIRDEKLIENARVMGDYLRDGLKNLMKTRRFIGDVRGRGLMVGIEIVKDRNTKEYGTAEAGELLEHCRDSGILVGKGGLFGNVVRIAPPLTITKKHCDQILKAMDEGLLRLETAAK
jgi:alanine-glyoxylate transaminase/(R)-3-amino-2-methylpropionate-pyruvate transaminase